MYMHLTFGLIADHTSFKMINANAIPDEKNKLPDFATQYPCPLMLLLH